MPHAVHSGALMPAMAWTAMGVWRDSPPGSRLKKSSGAWAVMLTCTNFAVSEPQSVVCPVPEVASVMVAKQVGGLVVLTGLRPKL